MCRQRWQDGGERRREEEGKKKRRGEKKRASGSWGRTWTGHLSSRLVVKVAVRWPGCSEYEVPVPGRPNLDEAPAAVQAPGPTLRMASMLGESPAEAAAGRHSTAEVTAGRHWSSCSSRRGGCCTGTLQLAVQPEVGTSRDAVHPSTAGCQERAAAWQTLELPVKKIQ